MNTITGYEHVIKSDSEPFTMHDYLALLKKQNGCCGICKKNSAEVGALIIDYDRETNVVRELLCRCCRKVLACFKDDPEIMKRVLVYIANDGNMSSLDD